MARRLTIQLGGQGQAKGRPENGVVVLHPVEIKAPLLPPRS
jgi:hypothetical protein